MKMILYGSEARKKMQAGINKLAQAVAPTLGPKGLNAVLGRNFGNHVITNDGVSIAKEIELEDRFENLGASLIRQVAEKTNDEAGDGTTTSTVLTQALVNEGMRHVDTGVNPVGIRRQMEAAKNEIVEILKKGSRKVTSHLEIAQVATISAESEELGELIASIMDEVGKDGVVTVEQSQNVGITSEVVQGMSFQKGFLSPTDDQKAELENPRILITDKKLQSVAQIGTILDALINAGEKNILIIADSFDDKMLYDLEMNKLRGVLNALCVFAPEYGENKKQNLKDLAAVTGGLYIGKETELSKVGFSDLGSAQKVVCTRQSTNIINGAGTKEEVKKRSDEVKRLIKESDSLSDKEALKKRLAKLSGGIGVIKVGASTETETVYLKHKIEDAVAATRAAVEEGIVIGGGCALVHASKEISQGKGTGYKILIKAIREPLAQIVKNGGGELTADVVVNAILADDTPAGYDAKREEYIQDMFKAGIIDPLRVTRNALENAVSVAALVLTTETAVVDKEPPKLAI